MTATGIVEYVAPVAGVRFAAIEVSNSHPAVEKIVVETQGSEQINVVFHLTDVFTDTEANVIAGDILASILNRLAFELDVSIGQPHLRGFSLPNDAVGASYTVSTSMSALWKVVAPTDTLDDERRRELARLLEQPFSRPDLSSAYRFAGTQSDPVTGFMFFYNILLQLHHDRQEQVDAFIRRKAPDVSQSLSPKKKGKFETVYTRLRNEVGHKRPGTTPEQTRAEIEGNVAALQTLVKAVISRVL
jgi:hypothetical protein